MLRSFLIISILIGLSQMPVLAQPTEPPAKPVSPDNVDIDFQPLQRPIIKSLSPMAIASCDAAPIPVDEYVRKQQEKVNALFPEGSNAEKLLLLITVNKIGEATKIRIINSSGSKENDEAIINRILEIFPTEEPPVGQWTFILAGYTPTNSPLEEKEFDVETLKSIEKFQKNMRNAWKPPHFIFSRERRPLSFNAISIFEIERDSGEIINHYLKRSSCSHPFDQAIFNAINQYKPIKFPSTLPRVIKIEFNFDYSERTYY